MFKKSFKNIGLIILFSLFSIHVNAQDTKHFSKIYLGGEIGYLDIDPDNNIAAGGFLGGKYQTDGDLVVGAELSVIGTLEEDTIGLFSLQGIIGTVTGEEKRNLFYIGAGYESGLGLANGEGLLSADEGFSIIAGYGRAVHDNIALRLQGKYIDLGSTVDDNNMNVDVNGFNMTAGVSFNS
jgi:opacity protein-like surface antigen